MAGLYISNFWWRVVCPFVSFYFHYIFRTLCMFQRWYLVNRLRLGWTRYPKVCSDPSLSSNVLPSQSCHDIFWRFFCQIIFEEFLFSRLVWSEGWEFDMKVTFQLCNIGCVEKIFVRFQDPHVLMSPFNIKIKIYDRYIK